MSALGGGDGPDETAAAGRPHDVRVGSHRDTGVRIDRDLTGGGRLARGSTTRYSTLRFSSGPPAGTSAAPASAAPAPQAPPSAAPPSDDAGAAAAGATEIVTEPKSLNVTDVTIAAAFPAPDLRSPRPDGPAGVSDAGVPDAGRGLRPALARLAGWFGRA